MKGVLGRNIKQEHNAGSFKKKKRDTPKNAGECGRMSQTSICSYSDAPINFYSRIARFSNETLLHNSLYAPLCSIFIFFIFDNRKTMRSFYPSQSKCKAGLHPGRAAVSLRVNTGRHWHSCRNQRNNLRRVWGRRGCREPASVNYRLKISPVLCSWPLHPRFARDTLSLPDLSKTPTMGSNS